MTQETEFDLFVIGAGSGGVRAARMAASRGLKVAVCEDRYLGGTCVNVGCVPKKLYVYASEFHEAFAASKGYGWNMDKPDFDWPTLRDNKKKEISRLNGIYGNLLGNSGVSLIDGRGSIVSPTEVKVGDTVYKAKNILIATGGWPFVPDIPGKELALTSNEIFDIETFPKRILIVGGGYIAVEFAGIFNGLGAQTTQLYRGPMFLRGFDEDVRGFVAEEMRKKNIDLKFNTNVASIEKQADGSLKVTLEDGSSLETDLVLYATGRKPHLTGLGLENTKVELNRGAIHVDDHFRTAEPNVYALGDVIDRVQLTPVALSEAMALVDYLIDGKSIAMDYNNIATAVFSQPNIGTIGMSEQQAQEHCGKLRVYKSDFRAMKHTVSGLNERSLMKIIVDDATDKVLGMHMVGEHAGEIMQGFAVAMKMGVTKAQLDSTIGIHPTAAEEFVTMRTPSN
ncbi:glutathione-disulfide reductase [Pelagibaculum spongiae]|uniref:Glutathione reductase n=1 Tax=Pelagibaculum spongiae TaxID=2080658 RepID=A0A2V1GSF2_9GAMM|nr:glutathione-disulfide reductase [Pelagibaculum spongiae]PVZ68222.1 glutathione-disulfide reductase [Pelagibaculum spongiae]